MYVHTYTHILYKYIIYNSYIICNIYLANSRDTNHFCKIVIWLVNSVFCNFYNSRKIRFPVTAF